MARRSLAGATPQAALYRLYRQQRIPRPIEEVFPFFERPENLSLITPPDLGFVLLTPSPVPMHLGALIDYRIRLLGLPVRWTTYIAAYDPPYRFVDVQLRGPYSFWHHTHRFSQEGSDTLMTDEVLYQVPFGPLGKILHALWIRRALARIFDYRQARIQELFSPSQVALAWPAQQAP
ncbi:MAG: SRPBCC family protein [Bacteroidetes bacterium]|nr:SRPBCC family protein [Rhodothermia bacterium]MCS7154746.1 SRPBCC family protein [Bacteroidota bacterium]MCX7907097.1 SRPBCC family protein [Bacteroidota bacterium]MDW8137539.1 SRPBCC family protein [Bacteroidota bacterium]MDW8285507.1 SRPBCC family protein [Bacteroidota bacterium]